MCWNMNGWLQIFLSCIMVFINVFVPPRPYYNIDNDSGKLTTKITHCHDHRVRASDDSIQHNYMPSKMGYYYHYCMYEKISSWPFCPSLSHLSAIHQPCACDCTECVEEMTCHISQHTRPTRNIKYASQQLIYNYIKTSDKNSTSS